MGSDTMSLIVCRNNITQFVGMYRECIVECYSYKKNGALQESVLEPVLFLLNINDSPQLYN